MCCTLFFAAAAASAQTKIDPFLDIGETPAAGVAPKASVVAGSESQAPSSDDVEVFVKAADIAAAREAIEAAGGRVGIVAGAILTASIPVSALAAVAENDAVLFIEAGKPIRMKNDVASGEINADDALAGTGLPSPLSGAGVIIGLVDTGIDYSHPDFQGADGTSRVLAIWDQNRPSGPSPAEIGSSFGTECKQASIADGSCPIGDVNGHGTHVAGTIAGRHETYGGVAPDANIVAVVYDSSLDLGSGYAETIFSTKICQAAYYVFAKAEELGMPAVVNLSLGTHIGPHDGTSLFEECLAGLVRGSAGRAIVAAAGNEFSSDALYTGIHAGFEVKEPQATNFVIRNTTSDRIYYIDVWGAPGSKLDFNLAMRDGLPPKAVKEQSGFVAAGSRSTGSFLGGAIEWSINATESASALNGKPHVGIRIKLSADVTKPLNYSFDLVAQGTGAFDAWLFPDKSSSSSRPVQFTSIEGDQGAEWSFVAGDRAKSVAMPATSPEIIAVGAYASRNRWESGLVSNCCQVAFPLGAILDFSSAGPSADAAATGQKPDLAAPGGMIASTLSRNATPGSQWVVGDGQHWMQAGTSMAAPFVSGTIALMFSASPNYTQADAKRYLTDSAYADEDVGEVPNDRWGFGKLDTLKAVEAAIAGGASGTFDTNGNVAAPAAAASDGGGKGCSLSPTATAGDLGALVGLFGLLPIWIVRRRADRLAR